MTVIASGIAGFYDETQCRLAEFSELTARSVDMADVPNAADVAKNVPIYDMSKLTPELSNPTHRNGLMAEWARILGQGAGVFVLRSAYPDTAPIDAATEVYRRIIAQEKANNASGADHFAATGSNDRVWNSLQKLCDAAPETFASYFATPAIDAACEAWLGPNYQMTAQVNLVYPGGAAQEAHRDYHLGFQTAEVSATYPAHVHDLSPLMTLQGAIAHCDMPVESGPTKLLPFSQLYRPGYAAWRRADFRAHFEANCVQLPLAKGDAIFFNPALFHAAGANTTTDVERMANLIQISSAFGRAMETIDRSEMCKRLLPVLSKRWAAGTIDEMELHAVIAASAEGYSFPTNLDSDPPEGGLAPVTEHVLLGRAVRNGMSQAQFDAQLDAMNARKQA